MLNKIINYSLRNRIMVVMAALLLMVVGLYTADRMEVDIFPDLNAPTVVVMTEAHGMAAEEVERTVTFVIEQASSSRHCTVQPTYGEYDRRRQPVFRWCGSSSTGIRISIWHVRS